MTEATPSTEAPDYQVLDKEVERLAAVDRSHRLYFMPLPHSAVGATEALRWLREDYEPYQNLASRVAADSKSEEQRTAAYFLSVDIETMVKGCAMAIETSSPVTFERSHTDNDLEYPQNTLNLARVIASREVFDDDTGSFLWAFDELAEELVQRLAGPIEAEAKRRADEGMVRPPLSSLSPEGQAK